MFTKIRIFIIICFFSIYSITLIAGNSNSNRMYFTNNKKRSLIVHFKLINNLIVIPLSINGSEIKHFILDSGVRIPIITELSGNDSLTLNYA